ncbi:MAG: DUF4340 domain-containing protein [Clostridia bacterium]
MKLYRNLIIPVVILAILAGVVWYVTSNMKPAVTTPEDLLKNVFVTREKNVKKVTIKFENYKLVFTKDPDDFFVMSYPKINVSSQMLSSITYESINLTALKEVTKNAINLNDYGFNNPYTVTINLKDNTTRVFYFGRIAVDLSGMYFREKGSKTVYLMDLTKANTIFTKPEALKTLVLFKSDEDSMIRIKTEKNGKLVYDIDARSKAGWNLLAPFQAPVSTLLTADIYKLLSNISVDRYLKGKLKPLRAYGLEHPKFVLTLVSKTSRATIKLGLLDENGLFYGKLAGTPNVFLIDPAKLSFVDIPLSDVMLKLVNLQDIAQVKKMEIRFDGHVDQADITYIALKNGTSETYLFNGQDVSVLQDDYARPLFKGYYEALLSIEWYKTDLNVKPRMGQVDLTIQYVLKDKSSYTLAYSKKNDDYYYVFKNGKYAGLVVEKEQLAPVKVARDALVKEALKKK